MVLRDPAVRWRADRAFFVGMAAAILITDLVGFRFGFLPPHLIEELRSPWVKAHVFAFASWILLFFAQTVLVASRRTDLHRALGIGGIYLAGLMIVLTIMSAVGGVWNSPPRPVIEYVMLYGVTHVDAIDFAILAIAGIRMRARDSDAHKRLMFMATVAVGVRFPYFGRVLGIDLPHYLDQDLFVLTGVVYDIVSRGRVHAAYLWGGAVIFILPPAAEWLFRTMVPHLVAVPK